MEPSGPGFEGPIRETGRRGRVCGQFLGSRDLISADYWHEKTFSVLHGKCFTDGKAGIQLRIHKKNGIQ